MVYLKHGDKMKNNELIIKFVTNDKIDLEELKNYYFMKKIYYHINGLII